MKRCKYEISIFLCAVLLTVCASLVSCEDGSTVMPDNNSSDNIQVGFRISLGDNTMAAKATPDGAYDDGTGTDFENYIDIRNEDYRILFFDNTNHYITTFHPRSILPVGSDPLRSKVYDVKGKVDRLLPENFKVVVIANWPQYPTLAAGSTTIADICNDGTYRYAPPFTLSSDNIIPMYGVKEYENMEFHPEVITYLGTIHLLRAMAKVEVNCPPNTWKLEAVSITRYNRTGYCAPEGVYKESDYVKHDYELDYVDGLHLVAGAAVSDRLYFQKKNDDSFVIYVPEYRNATDGARLSDACEIRLKFDERIDKEYVVEFKYYDNAPSGSKIGDYFDIRRNYYYRFNISKSVEYLSPAISVDVFPYEQYELEPEFGL